MTFVTGHCFSGVRDDVGSGLMKCRYSCTRSDGSNRQYHSGSTRHGELS